MYANFAGHDISMACAHYSTDDKYLGQVYDPEKTQLKFSQQDSLQNFYIGFCQKYTVKGRVVFSATGSDAADDKAVKKSD